MHNKALQQEKKIILLVKKENCDKYFFFHALNKLNFLSAIGFLRASSRDTTNNYTSRNTIHRFNPPIIFPTMTNIKINIERYLLNNFRQHYIKNNYIKKRILII